MFAPSLGNMDAKGESWRIMIAVGGDGAYRRGTYVSAHQKRAHWHAIVTEVRTLGVYNRRSNHCRKRWEDLRRWARKITEAQLGKSSQRGRGACRVLTPLMRRILAVEYPDLDGRLKAAQQSQGASTSGEGAEAPASGEAAAHGSPEAETTDAQGTSGTHRKEMQRKDLKETPDIFGLYDIKQVEELC
ncbi:hypothetical protein NDU88_003699 [Pleurodeles waltl]|uniref:Myb/SANT-like DNA-binding domain-containing protein n=1 Tax=Pleurodeles waltl TaxID=8319 RepID=A0AAV7KVL3_PLEWA|nr:hypothetical protein NDU88_003699 [Pleurodeles waltl]